MFIGFFDLHAGLDPGLAGLGVGLFGAVVVGRDDGDHGGVPGHAVSPWKAASSMSGRMRTRRM